VTVVLSSFGLWKLGEYILWLFKGMGENIEDVNAILIFLFLDFGLFQIFRPARRGLVRTWRLSLGLGLGCDDF
jgi:hypothetical protein